MGKNKSSTPRNLSSGDEDGDIVLSPKRQLFKQKVSMSTSINPSSDDENSDFSPSTSLSTSRSPTNNVFARYRYENTKKKKIASKRERGDSDSDYDPLENTNNKKKKKKKSMKEEADSDDDDEEEQKNESNKIAPKRQLFLSPTRQLSKPKPKKDEKWKTKKFEKFKFKYSIAPYKDSVRTWSHPVSFHSISAITTKPDDRWNAELSQLRSDSYSYGKKVTVDYDKTHIINDKDALKQLYDSSFRELNYKPIKPKPKKKKNGRKRSPQKDRHDWTIQAGIKKTKPL